MEAQKDDVRYANMQMTAANHSDLCSKMSSGPSKATCLDPNGRFWKTNTSGMMGQR